MGIFLLEIIQRKFLCETLWTVDDTSCVNTVFLNPPSAKSKIFPDNWVSAINADALAPRMGVDGAVRFLVLGTIGKEERPPRGQL